MTCPESLPGHPEKVLFPSPHLWAWPQCTAIEWDAGVNPRGRVCRFVNAAAEVFDGIPRRQGSKASRVHPGQAREFRLRKPTYSSLLASVTVTTDKTSGLPLGNVFKVGGRPAPAWDGPGR